jgi:hypothetical protein
VAVSDLVDAVLPVLEEVTRLRVGDGPVIRLVTPEAWHAAHTAYTGRVVLRDIRDFAFPDAAYDVFRRAALTRHSRRTSLWRLVRGAVVETEAWEPEILLVPDALAEWGVEDDGLMAFLAHHLARVGQHRASGGTAFLAHETLFKEARGWPDIATDHALHGHARWADAEVTTRLIGRKVGMRTGRESAEMKTLMTVVGSGSGSGGSGGEADGETPQAVQDAGAVWAVDVVTLAGADTLNLAWTDPSLLPTRREIADPEQWVARVARPPGEASP